MYICKVNRYSIKKSFYLWVVTCMNITLNFSSLNDFNFNLLLRNTLIY